MLQLYANNAKTTLAASITSTQTSITVAPGTGSLFPTPVPGVSWFALTLTSATSSSVYEITYCTSRSGDTLTVLRGQEGTTAQPFNLNDIAGNYDTAYVMENLIQVDQWQDNTYGLATAGGTVNALTATIPSNFTSIPNGMQIILLASGANTGPATLQLTLGSTVTSALPIIKGNNSPLVGGDIPLAGYPLTLIYSSTLSAWVITDIAVNLSPYALLNSPAFTGTPTAPTPAINNNSTDIATTAYVQNNLANYAPIFSPTLTGTPNAPTPTTGDNSTRIATTAFVQNEIAQSGGIYYTSGNLLENQIYYPPLGASMLFGWVGVEFANNTGGVAAIQVKDGSGNVLQTFLAGVTSGNDGGSGSNWQIPITIPLSTNAAYIYYYRYSGGNTTSFNLTAYMMR